ncbi:hypothetical protein IAG41_15050 [Sphingomonas sp. JC676]|uniref:hypothetical protein n=1 Tax=Sphingomonas sp. JC676 TaxID=2768065 RepID=UPI0016584A65|nr:hypothetical protein [Sphingomonas sp. JC676]MBC9033711.1 hypothetical protein [Sphingomonas sp. JC676]
MIEKTILERAFELARNGDCQCLDDIRRRLSAERYSHVDDHLAGKMIQKQLRREIKGALRS